MEEYKNVKIKKLDEVIDWYCHVVNPDGSAIYAPQRLELEEKFKKAGWDGMGKIELVVLTDDLSKYKTANNQIAWFAKSENNGESFIGFVYEDLWEVK